MTVLEPYDLIPKTMGSCEKRGGAERVLAGLRERCKPGGRIVFLAGVVYRQMLVPGLREWNCTVEIPMEGLRIGEQLRSGSTGGGTSCGFIKFTSNFRLASGIG